MHKFCVLFVLSDIVQSIPGTLVITINYMLSILLQEKLFLSLSVSLSPPCVYLCVCVYTCVYMCVCAQLCVYVCICVCVAWQEEASLYLAMNYIQALIHCSLFLAPE